MKGSKSLIDQRGSAFLEVLLVLVVVGVIAFVGIRVMGGRVKPVASVTTAGQTAVPTKIASTSDLQQASTALSTTDVTSVDLSSLDQSINSLL